MTGSWDTTARMWDAETGRQVTVLAGHGNPVLRASFSPDGKRVVTASTDRTARIWDVETSASIAILKEHGDGCAAPCSVLMAIVC